MKKEGQMRGVACFLGVLALASGCVLEDTAVDLDLDGSVEAGPCVACPVQRPVCLDGVRCVECTADEDDYCIEQMLVCNTETFECVACLTDAQCTTASAARCDDETFECDECDDNAQCTGVDGLPGDANACDEGSCVDCTPETEADTCPEGKSCNPRTHQCTDTDVGSLDVCEPCVADSECGLNGAPSEEHRCVPMFYQGTPFPEDEATGFCLKTTTTGCEQPFSITLAARPSLSNPAVEANYCGINETLATCPAVNALLNNERCLNGTDEECPQPSGLCERVGDLENRCTYRCGLPAQCPSEPPADSCGSSGSGGEDYCGG